MIFVDTNIFYNILYETELTSRAKRATELLVEPVTSVIVYNELLHITFRAYARRKYGIVSYHEFKKFFVEKGIEAFKEPLESVHELLEELKVKILSDYQSIEELKEVITKYRLLPTDAQIAITCRYHNISTIATLDEDFKRIPWLKVIP
ncbi:MAG: PIN domain-containing protein [Desulfurococcales archaeon]|nr:PIN domain-containing protein [Desulfurococcales archaeon]